MGKKKKKSKKDEIIDLLKEVQEKIHDSGGASLIVVTPDNKESVCATVGETEPLIQMLVSQLNQNEDFRRLIATAMCNAAMNHKGSTLKEKLGDMLDFMQDKTPTTEA